MSPDESIGIDEVRAEIVSQYGVLPTDRYCEAVLTSDLSSTEPQPCEFWVYTNGEYEALGRI